MASAQTDKERGVEEPIGAASESVEDESQGGQLAVASQWRLMWLRFRKHKIALVSAVVILVLYGGAVFCEFLAPYDAVSRTKHLYAPPQPIHILENGKLQRPFVYGLKSDVDPTTFSYVYSEDTSRKYPIKFFVHGLPYRMWGLFDTDIHLFGVDDDGVFLLMGTDDLGRDMLSRVLYASRISLSIGFVGVGVSFIIGCFLGGISGYFGGVVDDIVQRVIEFLLSIPTIPLWMALSAALPAAWSSVKIYFGITIILSLVGWGGLARVIRGKLLQLRNEDFVVAARLAGAGSGRIIAVHLIPSFASYLIVNITLAIPGMILGETALSFLNLGLRPPTVSWGVLLQKAQTMMTVSLYPWLLIVPCSFVVLTVLAFNFVGDGLRDAADPYAR